MTKQAITTFQKHCKSKYEIILVDNGSQSNAKPLDTENSSNLKFVQLNENKGFGFANNRGAELAEGDMLLFLNNDTMTISPFVEEILDLFNEDNSIGVVGPKLLNEDQTLQLSWGNYPTIINEFFTKMISRSFYSKNKVVQSIMQKNYSTTCSVDFVTGAAMFVRKDVFQQVGGFDENMFMYFEDADLCKRIKKLGLKILFYPKVELIHLRGASLNQANSKFIQQHYRKSQIIYYMKHNSKIELLLLKLYLKLTNKYPLNDD